MGGRSAVVSKGSSLGFDDSAKGFRVQGSRHRASLHGLRKKRALYGVLRSMTRYGGPLLSLPSQSADGHRVPRRPRMAGSSWGGRFGTLGSFLCDPKAR